MLRIWLSSFSSISIQMAMADLIVTNASTDKDTFVPSIQSKQVVSTVSSFSLSNSINIANSYTMNMYPINSNFFIKFDETGYLI